MEKVYVTAEIKRYSDGTEEISEYDERGNEIHYKTSYGVESWSDYDEKGKIIHYKLVDMNIGKNMMNETE